MDSILIAIEAWLTSFSQTVPIWLYIAVGGFIEEVIAPIPSPLIMASAGSLAASRGFHWLLLFPLAMIGAFGKTAGAYVLYMIVDRGEDVLLRRKKIFGISHEEIEAYGKKLKANRNGYVAFGLLRLLPFIPSSVISIAAGIIKVDKKVFLIGGFFGTIIRELFYLVLGFAGFAAAQELFSGISGLETFFTVVIFLLFVGIFIWILYKKRLFQRTMTAATSTHDENLSEEARRVLREKGTEAPFTGEFYDHHENGMYTCAGCGSTLFSSAAKFDSGTGWPSFDEPANLENVELREDKSHGMMRTEVLCKHCGGHLGHVFEDGPTGTKQRYCINSCALGFQKKTEKY